MNVAIVLLALIGATLIITSSTIFAPIRRRGPAFLKCAQCVGFWVGVAAGAGGLMPLEFPIVLDAFVVGSATSFLSQLSDAVLLTLLGEPSE